MKTTNTLTPTDDLIINLGDHEIEDFYDEVTEDYRFWSRNFNMHFGYYKFGRSLPFLRETMLEEYNRQAMIRLDIKPESKLIDFGCGMGGPMRYMLSKNPTMHIDGVTLSPFQKREGNKLLSLMNGKIHLANYSKTPFQSNSYHGVFALESLCHSGHSIKPLQEAYRLLKPGGRIVIADAFLKKPASQLSKKAHSVYESLCEFWKVRAFESAEGMKSKLEEVGFKDVEIEDCSMRVAPSVLHSIFTIPLFILKNLINGRKLSKMQWHNMKGAYHAMRTGLHQNSFGYFFISATKE